MSAALVFYLDDEPELGEVFCDLIQSQEIQVRTFTDAELFLTEVRKASPHVVFIDYRLPYTNGLEISKKIDPKVRRALVTGELEVQDKPESLLVLSKPFDRDLILQFIRESLA